MDKNSVIIKGEIVNKYMTRGNHIILTIKTCKHNFSAIFFPKAVSADMADEFKVGDNVEIVGNLQSTKKNNLFTCGIFGTEIRYAEDENRRNYFELEGRIVERRRYYVVYLKESAHIVDMLNVIASKVFQVLIEYSVKPAGDMELSMVSIRLAL